MNKAQADEFVERELFKVRGKSTYINIWHEINFLKKCCFNYQQLGHKVKNCKNLITCINYTALNNIYKEYDNSIIVYANYQKNCLAWELHYTLFSTPTNKVIMNAINIQFKDFISHYDELKRYILYSS